ncbi:MAG: hypothetical protein HXY30_06860 [Pseudorhodoplanes sp.]|nr:hypothetical protein [Pseudorhodoplanes sp.]
MAAQIKIAESGYGNPYLDSLISGYAWGGTPIRVAFAVGDIRPGGKDGTGAYWTAAEEQAFKRVMSEYEAVANIDYQITGDYDVFVFQSLAEKRDTILDFTTGEDLIGLSAAGFGIGSLYDLDFIAGSTPKAGAAPCFLYNTATGALSFDADGKGGAAAVAFATLAGAPELGLQDFVLV